MFTFLRKLLRSNQKVSGLSWAGLRVPDSVAEGNFCLAGLPGSGKTRLVRHLMKDVFPTIRPDSGRRAAVLDVKRDVVGEVSAIPGLVCPIDIMNPFDARSFAWDIGKDLKGFDDCVDFAFTFVQPQQGDNPYFANAARALVAGTLERLIKRYGDNWDLRDLVLVMEEKERLKQFLSGSFAGQYFYPAETYGNIVSTLTNAAYRLRPIAAAWQDAKKKSLREWATRQSSVLVFGGNPAEQEALAPINRVMFRLLAHIWMDLPDVEPGTNPNWVFNDELAEAGRLEGLPALLGGGRSKGVRCVLGFQDIDGLERVYGSQGVELADKCSSLSVLKIGSPKTARWAVDRFGDVPELRYLVNFGAGGASFSAHLEPSIRTGELLDPRKHVHVRRGHFHIEGLHLVHRVGTFFNTVRVPVPPANSTTARQEDFVRREIPPFHEFGTKDAEKLGITTAVSPFSESAPVPPELRHEDDRRKLEFFLSSLNP